MAKLNFLFKVFLFISKMFALFRFIDPFSGVGLSFCVRRPEPFFKGVLRPEVIVFGVLRPVIFWRPRPRARFYGVLPLTVFWRLASEVKKFGCLASWLL